MKFVRAHKNGEIFYAVSENGRYKRLEGAPFEGIRYTGESFEPQEIKLLVPCEPTKIVAVGLNYTKHAHELGEALIGKPVLFLKPTTSLLAHAEAIEYPSVSQRMDFEAELAVVIGKTCRCVSPSDAHSYIFGFTALNDVTARDLQKADGQWTRAKSFDTFCPVGPSIETDFDPRNKRVQSVLCGEVKQSSVFDDMIFGIPELVSFISECMTLLPGDIISTGTPEGIGPMQRGDTIEIRIEGLDTLINTVK